MTMTTMTRGDELTVTDLFCGAGGSSLGAEMVPGVKHPGVIVAFDSIHGLA